MTESFKAINRSKIENMILSVSKLNFSKLIFFKSESVICLKLFPFEAVKQIILFYFSTLGLPWKRKGFVYQSPSVSLDFPFFQNFALSFKVLPLKFFALFLFSNFSVESGAFHCL